MTDQQSDIWSDDLLGRQQEAQLIIDFIEGATDQARRSPTKGALTLAVDAGYGEGKSFFLSRLAKQLEASHPVAFVDAWTDDLADEPLTALVATLKRAVEPLATDERKATEVKSRLKTVLEKSGKVAKIAALGALRKGLSLAITGAAVDAAEEVLTQVADEVRDAVVDGLGEIGDEAIDGARKAIAAAPLAWMETRIKEFEDGRSAMRELKAGLSGLIESLDKAALQPPLVVIIDELDRCRPTYAIKLLEEIKHLFDVPGLVFIFGMHGEALAHSVRAAYGATFEGQPYLKRFVQRKYRLEQLSRKRLIHSIISNSGVDPKRFQYYQTKEVGQRAIKMAFSDLIDGYCEAYNLSPREIIELISILETASALASPKDLVAPLILPLAIGQIRDFPKGEIPSPVNEFGWNFYFMSTENNWIDVNPHLVASRLQAAGKRSLRDLGRIENPDVYEDTALALMEPAPIDSLTSLAGYSRLLQKVARIEIPQE